MGDNWPMAEPATPQQLGITWAPAEVEDAATLSAVFNEIADHDGTPERLSPETMAHELASAFAPLNELTTVGRAASGEVIAYSTVYRREGEAEAERVYVATYVRPDYREHIDESLTDWAVDVGVGSLESSTAPERYVFGGAVSPRCVTGGRWSACSTIRSQARRRADFRWCPGRLAEAWPFALCTMRRSPITGAACR